MLRSQQHWADCWDWEAGICLWWLVVWIKLTWYVIIWFPASCHGCTHWNKPFWCSRGLSVNPLTGIIPYLTILQFYQSWIPTFGTPPAPPDSCLPHCFPVALSPGRVASPLVICSCSGCFSLPVILPVVSPWPLRLCRRKKSLLLSVTQSFRAFFSRTSSGFSHISSNREGPYGSLRRLGPRGAVMRAFLSLSSASGAAGSILQPRGYRVFHDYPALPTAAGFALPRPVFSLTPHVQQLYTPWKIAYTTRRLTLRLHRDPGFLRTSLFRWFKCWPNECINNMYIISSISQNNNQEIY